MATTIVERKLLIGGEWVETDDWLEVRSPFSGEVVGRVAKAGADETKHAIDAAEAAMREPLPAHKRAEILVRVAMGLGRRHDEVARLISDEAGKPMKAARVEAKRAMSTYTFAAVEARKLAGEMVPMDAAQAGEGKLAFTLRRPIGVVGAISPFNFPLNLVAHKLAPALAAGCAVVLKPASQTPLSALLLAELEEEAGLPPGWLNVVAGSASEIGNVLVEDERVKAITFTGSGGVGWGLKERAPKKKVNLELGNATPVVIAADADIEAAAAAMAANAFSFAGQSCISVQRIYVERPAYDAFLERFLPRVDALVVGDPADEETDVGPVIDEGAKERILEWIEEARNGGAEVLAGGEEQDGLIRPTVVVKAAPELKVSLDEAIELANGTRYGLQAGIFTSALETALRAAQELDFGGVTVNEAPTFRTDQMPYGGVKDSGNTREGPHYAVRELTEEHLVVVSL
jgi:acyl-CoA reductase-like NAD-dependent aldehyde dehydrogenase